MNFLEAVGGLITQKIGDKEVGFKPLTLEQAAELIAGWSKSDRESLLEDLKLAGVSPMDIAKELRAHRHACSKLTYGMQVAQTARGIADTLEKACGVKVQQGIAPQAETLGLVMLLWGFKEKETGSPSTGESAPSATG